ncbi:MAG: PilZ domain-containing protein [Alphaproteobacteria bacterium]|jgi:hypothetical protein
MSEKRVAPRRKAFLVGKIIYGGETYTIDCTIRDISETGARVQVPDPFSVPNNITFLDPKNFCAYETSIVWRKGGEMGLSFGKPISLDDESNPRVKILRRVSMQSRAS